MGPMCRLRSVSNRVGLYGEAHPHVPVVSTAYAGTTHFESTLQWRRIQELYDSLARRVVPLPPQCSSQLQWYAQAWPDCAEIAGNGLWRAAQIHRRWLTCCYSQTIVAERPLLHLIGPIADRQQCLTGG